MNAENEPLNTNLINFSHDGSILASGGLNGKIHLCNVKNGECLKVIETGHQKIHLVAFATDGHTLASGNEAQNLQLWSIP